MYIHGLVRKHGLRYFKLKNDMVINALHTNVPCHLKKFNVYTSIPCSNIKEDEVLIYFGSNEKVIINKKDLEFV